MRNQPLHPAAHGPPPHGCATGKRPGWGEMLQTAARLGVSPEGFWRLSLREWRMLTERPDGGARMAREDLMRMAEAWPDD